MPEEHSITAIENTAGNSTLLFPLNQRLKSRWFRCCTILLSIEVENSGLSARVVFLPQSDLDHQVESLHDDLIIESTAFRLLLHPIHSEFFFAFSSMLSRKSAILPPRCPACPMCAIVIGILLVYMRFS